jgi:extracellular factor (EF) 3-hydroxypalmitic acid methyl ester biosynthesis protein
MYQQLKGALGREVYFRAPRVRASWISGKEQPDVRFAGAPARLCDLSLSGMLLDLAPDSVPFGNTNEFPIELSLGNEVFFRGTGVAVRHEERTRGRRIAIRLLGNLTDPQTVRQRAREIQFRRSLAAGTSVYATVPAAYRVAVFEAAAALNHWRALLNTRETELREDLGDESHQKLLELEETSESAVRRDWRLVREMAIAASEPLAQSDAAASDAARKLTELILTPVLADGLIWHHAYSKPRGYPGDFELMNLMYETRRRGSTIFSRILHQLGLDERLAATVRTRRELLADQISGLVRGRSLKHGNEIRITNLGAGPAQELGDVLREWDGAGRLVLTLIDQDPAALEFANRALRMTGACFGDRLEVRCRHVAFRELVKDQILLHEIADQDIVYSAGFLDYLPDGVATALVSHLASLLRPGGWLLVGNALDARDVKWVPEYVLDWHMIYRTEQDMRRLCRMIEFPTSSRILHDRSRAWQFLALHRES